MKYTKLMQAVHQLTEEVASDGLAPVCIAVCDTGGDLEFFLRMSGAKKRCISIAQAKARTASLMECSTTAWHDRLLNEHLSMADFCDPQMCSLSGGVPLIHDGQALGGIGISGRKPEQDEVLAKRLAALLQA